jgi:CRP/FNR family transcriptional regulator
MDSHPPDGAVGSASRADLHSVGLFSALSDATVETISRRAIVRRYKADEHIIFEGDRCEAVYFVLCGQIRIYRMSTEGREQVLVQLEAGQAFNTVPPFQVGGRNQASAVATSDARLLVLLSEDFLTLVFNHRDLALAVFRDFADRLVHLTGLVEDLALYTVEQRLIRFLLQQAGGSSGEHAADEEAAAPDSVPRRWTQQDIAMHLGTVRDVVGRALRSLVDARLIRIDRGKILLLEREELEKRAGH